MYQYQYPSLYIHQKSTIFKGKEPEKQEYDRQNKMLQQLNYSSICIYLGWQGLCNLQQMDPSSHCHLLKKEKMSFFYLLKLHSILWSLWFTMNHHFILMYNSSQLWSSLQISSLNWTLQSIHCKIWLTVTII